MYGDGYQFIAMYLNAHNNHLSALVHLMEKKDIILAVQCSRRSSHLEPLFDGSTRETRQALLAKEPTGKWLETVLYSIFRQNCHLSQKNEKFQTEILLTK